MKHVLNGEEEHESWATVKVLNDSRPVIYKISESLVNTCLPSGYPYRRVHKTQFHIEFSFSQQTVNQSVISHGTKTYCNVNEGYLRYTQFRALQHFSSATLFVLSTQSLLHAAGLRPTPPQATTTSWIRKDGMQHVGKLMCSKLGEKMDFEPIIVKIQFKMY
ncbi:unnamed protein product [Lactuca virosa]|uniref:Protein root UVB sensitive/RUS domain-containing protein n=1 Tax=Lactuca virosa TaxID=75947 RepID=A0AAU9LD77_9ASTR|nr:unnamed protein product [Lactuca virosa]